MKENNFLFGVGVPFDLTEAIWVSSESTNFLGLTEHLLELRAIKIVGLIKSFFFVVGCSVVVIKNKFDILISNSSINYVSFDRMEIGNRWKKFLLIF